MRRAVAGVLLLALLSGVSQGCAALGVAAAAGGLGAQAGWWLGKGAAKTPPEDQPRKEDNDAGQEGR